MNIILDEKQKESNKFLEFQRIWTLEKVKSMSLEEYTNLKHENPNYYCYWLDVLLKEYAGFGGNDAGKFGIYRYKKPPKKDDYLYDNRYAWRKNLGNTKDEVFEKVKKEIVKVIEYSQNNNLKCIDKEILNEILPFGLKWKIAFHYQNPNDIKIVNIFKKDILEAICKNEFKSNLEIYELHKKLLKDKIYTLDSMRNEVSVPLWGHYSNLNTKTTEQNKINFSIYLNKVTKKDGSKLSEGTKENYIEDISRISTKYLNVNLYKCDIEQFDLKCKELENNKKYLDQNSTNKNRYSSAIKYYRDFLINSSDKEFYNNKETNKGLNVENPPLNQILYGPPGTGKTYQTIDKALEIISKEEKIQIPSKDDRKNRKELFDKYVKNGQIVFTTFHQSYGYEEFVEGIKPIINNDENSQEVNYKIENGIFKELCEKALENRDSIKSFNFYINDLKEKAKEDGNNPEKYFKLPNTKYSIQYRGGKTFRIKFDDMSKNHKDYPVNIDNIEKLYKTSSVDEIYNLAYVRAILNYLKSQGLRDYEEKDEKTNLPYIIIIDEINRGNVSKIFGELITLIEPSKRMGEPEGLKVRLPYSGEEFGVSKNVYIIGTMNTADRSITSLDTALRRRFEFVEMMPDVSKLSTNCEGVNLQELLKAINTRIEYLLDREKTIGHAFFIGVENLNDLKNVFQNKIIPLLQEYFYNDYALIDAVLNENGMLEKQDTNNDYLKNITNFIERDNGIYKFSDSQKWDETTFKKIYMNNENK
ncbi:McrB family protein [Campylobacter armoricus]|uniref:Type IV methyl-directed restriction system, component McrB n=1 Tax=Campylobacter armoricus TaxID=2505970 RepID=A0A7L5HZ35_9BACT|nr:AAA family ATPase [Campylobacter armoricus]QKF79151.1 type IV methyl-directed restriction system, component McrB [Campylobacter armoricus]